MKQPLIVLLVLCLLSPILAIAEASIPESASTIEELKKGISDYYQEVWKRGHLIDNYWRWVRFNRDKGGEIFMLWFSPFSGRAACYLHGYYYDTESKKWIRFVNDLIDGTHLLQIRYPVFLENGIFVRFYGIGGNLVRVYNISESIPY